VKKLIPILYPREEFSEYLTSFVSFMSFSFRFGTCGTPPTRPRSIVIQNCTRFLPFRTRTIEHRLHPELRDGKIAEVGSRLKHRKTHR